MLYFLGNCQMDFLCRAMVEQGYEGDYRVLASPATYSSSPGIVPPELLQWDLKVGFNNYCHGRSLRNQFEMICPDEHSPLLIVMNLFHENSPLFIHNEHKYIFFVDPKIWGDYPDFEGWMKSSFGMIRANPATYLKRYRDMLELFLKHFPRTPVVIVQRLSHYPAFGPEPYSYLEGWNDIWRCAGEILRGWEEDFDNVHLVELDRVFAGIWNSSEKKIEAHCPFLKFELQEENDRVTGLHASRDVEHIGSMWPVLGRKISAFMESGRIEYSEFERVPDEWFDGWKPDFPNREKMIEMLSSGANYLCARAVGAFFLDLQNDFTDLLVQTRQYTPVCHNTLHMIKTYGRIHRNPALALWCKAHREAAAAFTANGPLYQQDYLNRIDEIERFALGV